MPRCVENLALPTNLAEMKLSLVVLSDTESNDPFVVEEVEQFRVLTLVPSSIRNSTVKLEPK